MKSFRVFTVIVSALALAAGCVKKSAYDESQAQLADKEKQLASAQQKLKATQSELAETNATFDSVLSMYHMKRVLPVSTFFRKTSAGRGYVFCIVARFGRELPVKIAITSHLSGKTVSRLVVLPSSSPFEIPNDPSQPLEDADRIEVSNPDFETMVRIYRTPHD